MRDILVVNSGKDYKHLQKGDIPVYGTGGYMLSVNEYLSNIDGIGLGRKGTINKPQFLNAPFWTVDTLFYLLAADDNEINFIYYLVQKINWKKYDESTGVPSLSKKTIEIISQNIPNKHEQIRIAKLLNKLDDYITLHQGKLEKLKELKNGLLQQMFPKKDEKTPKLRFTNFKDDWSKKKIKYLGEIRTGNTPSTSENKFWIKGSEGYPWITPSDISSNNTKYTEKKLSKEGWEVSRKVPKNSVLVTCIASIGKNTINLEDSAFNQQINAIIPIKNNSYFILTLMNKNSKLFESLAGKTATSIINKNDFSNIPLIITNIQEQQKIGDLFKKIDILQAQHEQKLDKLQLLKKSLLQKMFI